MAVTLTTLGAHGATGANGSGVNSVTWEHTIAAGDDLLLVGVAYGKGGADLTSEVPDVTYGAATLTLVDSTLNGNVGTTNGKTTLFKLESPSVGIDDVLVDFVPTAVEPVTVEAGSMSFAGVAATPLGTSVTGRAGTATGVSATVANTTVDGIVVSMVGWGDGTPTFTGTEQWRAEVNGFTAGGNGGQATTASTGSDVTLGVSAGATNAYGVVVVEVLPELSTPQFARPTGTAVTAGWTASGAATIPAALAETVASDAEYARSENSPSGSAFAVPLSSVTDPASSTGHVLRYRYDREIVSGAPTVNLTVQLRQGYVSEASQGTVVATATHNGIADALVTGSLTLTGTEADSISDYADLSVRFVATQA